MEDSSDRWPRIFDDLKARLTENGEQAVLAEVWEEVRGSRRCARRLTCGLVQLEDYEKVTGDPSLGHEVDCNGPHPLPRETAYDPRFSIFAPDVIGGGIEPLVPSWTSHNQTVQHPDLRLLMTYGLVPRFDGSGTIRWDNPEAPEHDILVVRPLSSYKPFEATRGDVHIQRRYLADYASLRQRAVVCVFYERWIVEGDAEAEALLSGQQFWERRFSDAYIRILRTEGDRPKLFVEITGHRLILQPGPFPISEDAVRYDEFTWPGIAAPITDAHWRGLGSAVAYVKDEVLGRFEGRTEYDIHPETGGLSFGTQWGVSYCERVGRDTIRVELRKLYEGTPPEIVRHYHHHAVPPPSGDQGALRRERNIGMRARDVVHALARLGDAAAAVATQVLNRSVSSRDVVGLDLPSLRHQGWWTLDSTARIGRHVPRSMTRDGFVGRCKDLYRLVGEGLREGLLRKLMLGLGVESKSIASVRSVGLLEVLVNRAMIAKAAGLELKSSSDEVLRRFESESSRDPCRHLRALIELRQLDSHNTGDGTRQKLETNLKVFGIDPANTVPGYGSAVDAVYDKLADELNACAEALEAT